AGERGDVLVAELVQRLRAEDGTAPDGAIDDDRLRVIGGDRFDARLEEAAGDVNGTGDLPLVPLVLLADVDEERRVGGFEKLTGAGPVHLVDLAAHLLKQVAVGPHDYPKYSVTGPG